MSEAKPALKSAAKCFGGRVEYYEHHARTCNAAMRFAVYLPPAAERGPVPVLYWLSGLTCTEENFMIKAGAQAQAAARGVMLVAPDTSPRGLDLPGEHERWDFGSGAGFYVNATNAPWSDHYRMYDYVAEELPEIVARHFPSQDGPAGIFGHSMGGHGALVLGLRNPRRFRSISAFAPICAPMHCPWGEYALAKYLGEDRAAWADYDACALLAGLDSAPPLLVDQGEADNFLAEQLMPERLEAVCRERGHALELRRRPGYDHSYYFIASFIGDHFDHHVQG